MSKIINKKNVLWAIVAVALTVLLVFAILNIIDFKQYKRIDLDKRSLGPETIKMFISSEAEVVNNVSESFPDTFPAYKITEHIITDDEYDGLVRAMGIRVDSSKNDSSKDTAIKPYAKNEISLYWDDGRIWKNFDMSDEVLERKAREVFDKITFLDGEYEYLGITSTRIGYKSEDEKYIDSVRVSFRRLVDGYRVIGNDICDFYFNGNGVYDIEIRLYDYEKIDDFELMPIEEAMGRVKSADSFTLTDYDYNKNGSSEKFDTLKAERVKLLFVNQYTDGCEILQPVYNIMGSASSASEEYEFSAKIIAIPEWYTYTEEPEETSLIFDEPT